MSAAVPIPPHFSRRAVPVLVAVYLSVITALTAVAYFRPSEIAETRKLFFVIAYPTVFLSVALARMHLSRPQTLIVPGFAQHTRIRLMATVLVFAYAIPIACLLAIGGTHSEVTGLFLINAVSACFAWFITVMMLIRIFACAALIAVAGVMMKVFAPQHLDFEPSMPSSTPTHLAAALSMNIAALWWIGRRMTRLHEDDRDYFKPHQIENGSAPFKAWTRGNGRARAWSYMLQRGQRFSVLIPVVGCAVGILVFGTLIESPLHTIMGGSALYYMMMAPLGMTSFALDPQWRQILAQESLRPVVRRDLIWTLGRVQVITALGQVAVMMAIGIAASLIFFRTWSVLSAALPWSLTALAAVPAAVGVLSLTGCIEGTARRLIAGAVVSLFGYVFLGVAVSIIATLPIAGIAAGCALLLVTGGILLDRSYRRWLVLDLD
jgi:hypothetical protein